MSKKMILTLDDKTHTFLGWLKGHMSAASYSEVFTRLLFEESRRIRKQDPNAPVLALGKKGAGG